MYIASTIFVLYLAMGSKDEVDKMKKEITPMEAQAIFGAAGTEYVIARVRQR